MKYLLAAGFLAATAFGQQNFDNVQIKTIKAGGAVHMLEGAGGNIGVSAGDDGAIMVDTQFAPMGGKIATAVEALGHGLPKFVINTHHHGDHTGGNGKFGTTGNVVAHANVRIRLEQQPNTPKEALPKVTYGKDMSLHFNGEEIRLIHIGPGHTDGDTIVHFTKSGVWHMGDLFFNGRFPFVDLGSGGNLAGYMKNIEEALKLIPDDAKIIPGHGPLAKKSDLQQFNDMLIETTGIVKKAIADGKSKEDILGAGLPEKWKEWGTGFINTRRWVETMYNSFTTK